MRVYVDGISVRVPQHVQSCAEAHEVLGVDRDEAVVLQARPGDDDSARLLRRSSLLSFRDGWTFEEGDRYARVDLREAMGMLSDDMHREPWEKDPEDWKP